MHIRPHHGHPPSIRIARRDGIWISIRPLHGRDAVAGFCVGDVPVRNPVGDHFSARIGHAQFRVLAIVALAVVTATAADEKWEGGGDEPSGPGQFHDRMLSCAAAGLKPEGQGA